MARTPSLLGKIRDLVRPQSKPVPGGGIAVQSTRTTNRRRNNYYLPIDQPIIRTIKGDRDLTREICEIGTWSAEFNNAVGAITTDTFQQLAGQSSSWRVAKTKDGADDGDPTHPDVIQIAKELEARMFNGRYVLGGDRLQMTSRDSFIYGDGFLELGIGPDGTGQYCVNRTLERPSLCIIPVFDNIQEIEYYSLREDHNPNEEVARIPRWKMLQVSRFQGRNGLGEPASLQMVDSAWRPLKQVAADLSDAIRSAGCTTRVHTFNQYISPDQKAQYEQQIQDQRESGMLFDLFAYEGTQITEIGGKANAVEPLAKAFMNYRSMMIPFGVPAWAFPGIQGQQDSNKDIANQPALLYARQIANNRSLLGEKIKWALAIEITLKKGYEFYLREGQFEVVWGDWFVTGMEDGIIAGSNKSGDVNPGRNRDRGDQDQLDQMERLLSGIYQQQQHSIDLINTGKVIAEAARRAEDDRY